MLQRRFLLVLVCLVTLSHAWAMWAFGATFWVDSSIFAELAGCLGSTARLSAFYDSAGTMVYSHIGVGLPLLWAGIRLFPLNAQWLLLAFLQHTLAAAVTIFAFATANRLRPSAWHLLGAALLSWLPFFQSLHNALMTESVTASVLLLAMALILRLLHTPAPSRFEWVALLACVFIVIQFRSYVGLMIAVPAAAVLCLRRLPKRGVAGLSLLAALAAGVLAFPAARYFCIHQFFLPSGGTNTLVHAVWVNASPSKAVQIKIQKIGLPEGWTAQDLFKPNFDYERGRDLAVAWKKQGLDEHQMNARIGKMHTAILSDRPEVLLNCLRCGLACNGWSNLAFAGRSHGPVFAGLDLRQSRAHHLDHYRWLSWIKHNSYWDDGNQFFLHQQSMLFNSHEEQSMFWDALKSHLQRGNWIQWRDPLRLGLLPMDVWPALGLIGLIILMVRMKLVSFILGFPLLLNLAVAAALPVADPRYGYILIPLYLLASTLGLACLTAGAKYSMDGERGERSRPAEQPGLPVESLGEP